VDQTDDANFHGSVRGGSLGGNQDKQHHHQQNSMHIRSFGKPLNAET
jgi:hypothetical protein